MNRAAQPVCFTYLAVLGLVLLSSCSSPAALPTPTPTAISPTLTATISPTATTEIAPTVTEAILPTATTQEATNGVVRTGLDELDRVIQIVLNGDTSALRSLIQFTQAGCTFEDGLGGPPKCEDGEDEGDTVEVLPFLGPEGHFLRVEDIESWEGIQASDLYAVYVVSDSTFSDPLYPRGQYAIAFINEARFLITTLQIVDGQIVRIDSTLGNPPMLRLEEVDRYLIAPRELDQ